jgi:23S rRNA (guanine2445-N2)-methyltransferase / 23S rRNA (guanine2069-N7)-methyltransferase
MARQEALSQIQPGLPIRILGCDQDASALRLAGLNAKRVGVQADIEFRVQEFSDLSSQQEFGCVITNPPYGARSGDPRTAQQIYRQMPQVLRKLRTWSHYILSPERDFETLVGRQADRRRKLYNGRIECTLYQFFGPRRKRSDLRERGEAPAETEAQAVSTTTSDTSPRDRTQAFGGLTERDYEQARLLQRRLEKRAHHLRRWPTKMGITCYRLYDRDIPEIPLIVDRYEDFLHINDYTRPHDRDIAQQADWLDLMARTAARTLGLRPQNVFTKRRQRARNRTQYARVADKGITTIVREGGLNFLINLSDYIDTGLFLDHRVSRSLIKGMAAGKRFLNLFAYTGSFTVYAIAGGARATVTVDHSSNYLKWAKENLLLNSMGGREHTFVREDAKEFVSSHPAGSHYDLVVVDPPTYSNSKHAAFDWDVQRDHEQLLRSMTRIVPRGGEVFFSTSFRRFRLSENLGEVFSVRDVTRQTIPPDFRNPRVHRAWRLVVLG